MFFILSKLLAFLISPFNLSIIFIITSLIFKQYRKTIMTYGLSILMLFSNPFVFRCAIQAWEEAPQPLPTDLQTCRNVVVLGGMSSHHAPSNRIRFAQSADRLMQAIEMVKTNQSQHLIITGGSANIMLKQRPEAAALYDFLKNNWLADSLILIDTLSRNTHENALHTSHLFDDLKLEKEIVLVTSAWHMPRAKRCFEKEGFRVVPVGADFLSPLEKVTPGDILIPSAGILQNWDLLMKEWLGMAVYKLKGYI
ncbi:MAG: YdcF family protein [Marinilabiliaceae bacterium]|nr:YdcF family protein [Marinilabiliaceae bacterium]